MYMGWASVWIFHSKVCLSKHNWTCNVTKVQVTAEHSVMAAVVSVFIARVITYSLIPSLHSPAFFCTWRLGTRLVIRITILIITIVTLHNDFLLHVHVERRVGLFWRLSYSTCICMQVLLAVRAPPWTISSGCPVLRRQTLNPSPTHQRKWMYSWGVELLPVSALL